MKIRALQDGDQKAVAAIHEAMCLDYQMPDLDGRMIPAKNVCEADGEVIAASALRYEAEAFLWIKPGLDPRVKWDAIRMMQRDMVRQAVALGIEQLVAYVPECIGKFFAKRMKLLKWSRPRDGWTPWVYEVKP